MHHRTDKRRRLGRFLGNLFASNAYCKGVFYGLCRERCSPRDLAILVFAGSVLAVGDSKGAFKTIQPSKKEINRLVAELQTLADVVGGVNETSLNPKLGILAQLDDERDPGVRESVRLFDILPKLMKAYAIALDRLQQFRSNEFKQRTLVHFAVLRLVLYVEERTGTPRYEDVSNLLTAGFLAAGGAEDKLPKFFTPDALTKLNLRTRHFGLNSRF